MTYSTEEATDASRRQPHLVRLGRSTRSELVLLALAVLFVFTNGIVLSLVSVGRLTWEHLWAPSIWFVLIVATYLALRHFIPHHDPYLLPVVGLLTGWGFILLDRLAPNFLERQVLWLALAMAVLVAVAILPRDLQFLRHYRYSWLATGLLLLAATLFFGVNPSGQGSELWLKVPLVGQVYFQPSELLKLLLVVFLASYFSERAHILDLYRGRSRLGTLSYIAPLVLMWGFCVILLVWQRDLGAATLFLIVFLALLYLATGDWRYVMGGLGLLILAGALGYYAFDVVALRIDTWWNPWDEADSRGFQIVQSLYAVSSGSVIGQGVAQGFPDYIPVVHSDFAFAAIAEEWGLVGTLTIVACFALLAHRGLRIATVATRSFQMYFAAGIAIVFSAQALLIMAGVTKLLPLTGVTLPFVSYGGSSLLMSCVMIGLLFKMSSMTASGLSAAEE